MDISTITRAAVPILKKHGVIRASLFGSAARGEMNRDSDIDILIEIPKDRDLFAFMDIQFDLEDTLGTKIDLVEYDHIKPRLKPFILKDQIRIYVNEKS